MHDKPLNVGDAEGNDSIITRLFLISLESFELLVVIRKPNLVPVNLEFNLLSVCQCT